MQVVPRTSQESEHQPIQNSLLFSNYYRIHLDHSMKGENEHFVGHGEPDERLSPSTSILKI